MAAASAGLAQSLQIKRQRDELSAIGRNVGTPVLFLKAAWADSVLYGGRGERRASDIDILVGSDAFAAFGRALEQAGYRPYDVATHPVSIAAGKEREYAPPPDALIVDLHRGLTDSPWYELDAAACIARGIDYPSVDGEILSLAPTDQLLFAAAHAASHCLEVDERQVEDMRRMLARYSVDWRDVHSRARHAGLEAPLGWLIDRLTHLGVAIPVLSGLSLPRRLGLRTVTRLGRGSDPDVSRMTGVTGKRWVLCQALLSGRETALPRFLWRYAHLRSRDFAMRIRRRR